MRRLILIRHAASAPDPARPAHAWGLAEGADSQIAALAAALRPLGIDTIFSSSEPKAIATATQLAQQLPADFADSLPEFDEHRRATLPWFAERADFEAAVARLFANPADLVLGEETAYDARGRFAGGVYEILDDNPNDTLAVVTHGTVMALFLAPAIDADAYAVWQQIQALGMPCYAVLTLPDFSFITLQGVTAGAAE